MLLGHRSDIISAFVGGELYQQYMGTRTRKISLASNFQPNFERTVTTRDHLHDTHHHTYMRNRNIDCCMTCCIGYTCYNENTLSTYKSSYFVMAPPSFDCTHIHVVLIPEWPLKVHSMVRNHRRLEVALESNSLIHDAGHMLAQHDTMQGEGARTLLHRMPCDCAQGFAHRMFAYPSSAPRNRCPNMVTRCKLTIVSTMAVLWCRLSDKADGAINRLGR